MPQDDLTKLMRKLDDNYYTTSELSKLTGQSAPCIRRMIRKMLEQNEVKQKIVTRFEHRKVFAYKLK